MDQHLLAQTVGDLTGERAHGRRIDPARPFDVDGHVGGDPTRSW
jgi:hypothetical protein